MNYTVDAAKVMSAALRGALARNAPQLGTTGLLVALLSASDTSFAAQIQTCAPGIAGAVLSRLDATTAVPAEVANESARLGVSYSANLRAALEVSADLGQRHQNMSVQCADLLLGLLSQPRSGAVGTLVSCGIEPDELRELCDVISHLETELPAEGGSASAGTSLTVPTEWTQAEPPRES